MFENNEYKKLLENELGGIEKWLRLKIGFTLDNVAIDLGISKGNLSEIESGKRKLKSEVFLRFLLVYQISLNPSEDYFNESKRLLDSWLISYFKRDSYTMERIANEFKEISEQLECSFGCLNFILLKMLICVFSPSEKVSRKKQLLKQVQLYENFYLPDYRALIYYSWAFLCLKTDRTDNAIYYLHEAQKLCVGSNFKDLAGMICFYLGRTYGDAKSFEQGVLWVSKARDAFYQTGNLFRLQQSKHNLALFETYLHCFELAQTLFDEIIEYANSSGAGSIAESCVQNKLLLFFLSENYEYLLDYVKKKNVQNVFHGEIVNFCFVPCSYYQLSRETEMLQIITEMEKQKLDLEDHLLFSLLRRMQARDRNASVEIYDRYITRCIKKYNWGMMMALNKLMQTFSRRIEDQSLELILYHQKDQIFRHEFPTLLNFQELH